MFFKFYQIPNLKNKKIGKKLVKIKLLFKNTTNQNLRIEITKGRIQEKGLGLVVLVLFLLEILVTDDPWSI